MSNVFRSKPFLYAAITLAISWGLTFALFMDPQQGIKSFALIMFVPMFTSIAFRRIPFLRLENSFRIMRIKGITPTIALVTIALPLGMIGIIAGLDLLFSVSKVNSEKLNMKEIALLLNLLLPSLVSSLGEELGWRGYLLPALEEKHTKLKATLITGAVWSSFHLPAMYLLALATEVGDPALLVAILGINIFCVNFLFSYLFFVSRNVWTVTLFHAIWNVANPYMLGNLYTNEAGVLHGPLLVQNGEGIMGILVFALAAVWVVRRLKNGEDLQ